jgi:hypothetical protein
MAKAVQEPRHSLKRTHENMSRRKRVLTLMANSGARGAGEKAKDRAKRLGVNLDVDNAWTQADAEEEDKVFGPCPYKDNIWQCLPQPNLHGMDEGLTQKLNSGVVEALVAEAQRSLGMDATKVRTNRAL